MTGLVAESASIDLDGRTVLTEISLSLPSGRLLGLIGPNGAGKTSLLRLLCGLVPASRGRVMLDGRRIENWAGPDRARRIAYLPQDPDLHWPLSASDVIGLGRLPYGSSLDRMSEADRAAIAAAAKDCGVGDLLGRPFQHLSGGEKARILIARALAQQAPVLLADEPIAQLDPHHQLRVMEVLKEKARAGGSVIAVLHDLTLAARFADDLLLLSEGRMIAAGSPAEVLTSETMREVYHVEAAISEIDGGLSVIPLKRI